MRGRRGVLEGLPLTLIISIVIIAIGTTIMFSLYSYAESHHLSSLTVTQGPARSAVNGWLPLWYSPLHLEVTAVSSSGGGLGGVIINLNGSGISIQTLTATNGTAMFLLQPPSLPEHATDGLLTISASYSPAATLGTSTASEGVTVSEVILG